jgi:hypothetical protein
MRKIAMIGLMAALAAAGILTTLDSRLKAGETFGAPTPSRTSVSSCALWKEAASRTIEQLARARSDVNLLRVSESIAGMRRAHRLCQLGFLVSACREYDAIIRGNPSHLHLGSMPPMCQSIAGDTPAW